MDLVCARSEGIMIPVANPGLQNQRYQKEIQDAITNVLNSGTYIMEQTVADFEQGFAKKVQCSYGVGVASGTDALKLALRAANIGPGDEVITVSHTATATVAAIIMVGAKAVLVDVDNETYTIDPNAIESAISPRTSAIIPVHLYGQAADMDKIGTIASKNELIVIEDCAQAHGATFKGRPVGSMGDIGCFSFYPTKNLGGIGDGGMITTDDQDLYIRLQKLREYGWDNKRVSQEVSDVSRLDAIQAAVLNVKLNHLDEDNSKRKKIAEVYSVGLKDTSVLIPEIDEMRNMVYHQYVIKCPRRDALKQYLYSKDVGTGIHYPVPCHQQPGLSEHCLLPQPLVNTEQLVTRILSLPIYPDLRANECGQVIELIKNFYEG